VAGNEDVDGDVSGEEAAWRDLVARFDLPVDTDAEQAPWPARENLTETARDRQLPDQDADWEESGPGGPAGPAGRPGPARSGPANLPGPASLTGAGLRPGSAGLPDGAGTDEDGTVAGIGPLTGDAATGTGESTSAAERDGGADERDGGPEVAGRNGDRARIIRRAGPARPAPAEDDDEDDRYVPPPPEPLPQLDSVAKGAWAGVLGGPGYLLVARLVGWQVPDWAALAAIIAFVAGFATLVVRMSDRPRDDYFDGAVF
jgi:hypothetical protein